MTNKNSAEEHWINARWRPMMGWTYVACCVFDFIIFPILFTLVQLWSHAEIHQWSPITLQNGGLFHMAMGAVLGVAAYGRTQEKINGFIAAPNIEAVAQYVESTKIEPVASSKYVPPPITGYGGKLAPPPAPQPLI